MESFKPEKGQRTAEALATIFEKYKSKRVVVVGVPGSGKSTLLKHLPEALDMDKVLFPKLSEGEKNFALQRKFNLEKNKFEKIPYNEKDISDVEALTLSADVLQTLAEMHLEIEPGHPQFATLVLPSDVIVYLKIDDELLRERLLSRETQDDRPQQYEYVKKIEELLERSIQEAKDKGTLVEEFLMKKGLHDK